MKKAIVIAAVIAAVGVSGFMLLRRSGGLPAGLDERIARQVVRIASAYLVPTITFDSFAYRHPGAIDLRGVRLTAPDGTEVVRAGVLSVTLAETPRLNSPIVIERIELKDAALRLVATPEGGFKGLVPFVKGEAVSTPESVEEDLRLSRVMKIRLLALENGALEYDDGSGAPPMRLTGLTLRMDIDEAGGDGWYAIDTSSALGGLADLAVKGRVNTESLQTSFERVRLATTLAESTYSILPPAIQQVVRTHEARGALRVEASGDLPLRDWRAAAINASVAIRDFNVSYGEYRLPIDSGAFPLAMSQGRVTMPEGRLELLGGAVALRDASLDMNDPRMPAAASWDVAGLDLQRMLRVATPAGQPPRMAGIVQSQGAVRAAADDLPASIAGSGNLALRQGRLVNIPVITDLIKVMDVLTQATGQGALEDTLDAEYNLDGQGVRLTSLDIRNPVAHLRGDGTIFYDTSLDLSVNGGPLERVQGALGRVGEIFGRVTDKLMRYRITGTLAEPRIGVSPLGL